jgi:hypothetical protein
MRTSSGGLLAGSAILMAGCLTRSPSESAKGTLPSRSYQAECWIGSLRDSYVKADSSVRLKADEKATFIVAPDGKTGAIALRGPTQKQPFLALFMSLSREKNETSAVALTLVQVQDAGETRGILTAMFGSEGMVHFECRLRPE